MRATTHDNCLLVILPAAALAMVLAAGCSRQAADAGNASVAPGATNVPAADTGSTAAPQPPAADGAAGSNPLVVATEGAPAPYVANSAGTALYALEGDTDGSRCDADCTQTWPPMLVEGAMPSESAGLQAAMVGVVQRADGTTQVAYNGHPLYRYGGDTGAARTSGHGVSDKWGHWSLVGPGGAPVPAGK